MIVSDSYPNLINGVSQQAEALRLNSQVEMLENAVCSVVDGLHKRQPTYNVKKLHSATWNKPFTYLINRDSSERYIVCINEGDLRVFDLGGNLMTILYPDGDDYLDSVAPSGDALTACTVEDTTFILNRERTVAMYDAAVTPALSPGALIWVRQGLVGHEYNIEINGSTVATYSDSSSPFVRTDWLTADLATQIMSNTGGLFAVLICDNLIYVTSISGVAFQVRVWDSYGNQAMTLIKDRVEKLGDLPDKAFPGMRVEVQGNAAENADDYWVQFVPDHPATFGRGVWSECAAPSTKTTFDAFTMPFILQRTGADTFTFKKAPWAIRTAGDATTAPEPSFVGQKINDVFVYRGRLGMLAGENVIFSQAAEFYNFWPTTVTAILDDARIDYRVGGTSVAVLYHALPFQDQLLLFSDQSQLTLSHGDTLTEKTVSTTVSTVFNGLVNAKPINSGSSIFFATSRGNFSGVREYFVQSTIKTNDAADITAHVPRYIEGTIQSMTSCTTLNSMVVRVTPGSNSLYLYQWLWNNNEKIQSAWSRWTFDDADPLGVHFVSEMLFLIVQRTDGVWMEKVEMSRKVDVGLEWMTCLDRIAVATFVSSDLGLNTTTWTVPYYDDSIQIVVDGVRQTVLTNTDNTTYSTVVTQGVHDADAKAGIPYNFQVKFTKPFIKVDAKMGGFSAMNQGRLQISDFYVRYASTGFFQLTVQPEKYNSYTYDMTGRFIDGAPSIVNVVAIESGVTRVPVRTSNQDTSITISNDTFLPCFLLSAEWTGVYYPKSRRI